MPAPWEENQYRVVVEFLKTNEGTTRLIRLKHSAAVVPPQLQGRISPQTWGAFMTDMEQASKVTYSCRMSFVGSHVMGSHE
jgi:hypothetical protein